MAISKKPRAILKTNSSGFKLCRNLLVRSMFITDQFSQKNVRLQIFASQSVYDQIKLKAKFFSWIAYFITLPFIYSLWWLRFNSVLTVFFFREEHPPKCTLSLNIKISGNYHKVNIYFLPGESSLNFSTLLLKVTCMKLLLWQTRTAVRLV